MSRASLMAAFAVTLHGRFWVTPEDEAVATWNAPIDFLLIDGDHAQEAVQQDWDDWHHHVVDEGSFRRAKHRPTTALLNLLIESFANPRNRVGKSSMKWILWFFSAKVIAQPNVTFFGDPAMILELQGRTEESWR